MVLVNQGGRSVGYDSVLAESGRPGSPAQKRQPMARCVVPTAGEMVGSHSAGHGSGRRATGEVLASPPARLRGMSVMAAESRGERASDGAC